jgi:hypothetical protein
MKINTLNECKSILFDELFVELQTLTERDPFERTDTHAERFTNIIDKCGLVATFVEQEFFQDPIKTRFHVDYFIRKIDAELIRSYDYYMSNVDQINVISDMDEDLQSDLLFEIFNGEKIQERGITDEQVNNYLSLHNYFTCWTVCFSCLLHLAENLNCYFNEITLTFESHSGLHEDKIFSKVDNFVEPNIVDNRRNPNAPTNKEKIKALKYLAPELWDKLQKSSSKETQQRIIHAITGTNLEDAYKYSFGSRGSYLNSFNEDKLTALLDLIK